jgi:hypothetical protein
VSVPTKRTADERKADGFVPFPIVLTKAGEDQFEAAATAQGFSNLSQCEVVRVDILDNHQVTIAVE